LVSDEQMLSDFESWTLQYPGVSSFDYDFEEWLAGGCPAYPYALGGLAIALRDAEWVRTLDLEEGVMGWKLQRRLVERGEPRSDDGYAKVTVGELGSTLYLLWSHDGEQHTLDLAGRIADGAVWVDGRSLALHELDATAIQVGIAPMVIGLDAEEMTDLLDEVACP
jgi:hypothetical protein